MKQHLYRIMVGGLIVATGIVACDSASTGLEKDNNEVSLSANNKYIVVLKRTAGKDRSGNAIGIDAQVRDVSSRIGLSGEKVSHMYDVALRGFAAELTPAQLRDLSNDDRVDYIEPDHVVMLAPIQAQARPGGGGGTTGQTTPWGITRVGGAQNGVGKTAWIVDTGIDLDHPDLTVDVARSRTFFTSGKDASSADDGNGHGTHVAGTVAAKNNTTGVIGVAAGATVVAVKVLDSRGSGAYSVVIAGVNYVAANAAPGDAVNMSLGGPVSQALDDAVLAAAQSGIRFALAAGNESKSGTLSSPGRVNHANIWTVSAIDNTNKFASFSNFGNPPVDFAAPGVSINSTWKGGAYNTISGTSMASPHVCGILLMRSSPATNGFATSDPDGNPDPVASL